MMKSDSKKQREFFERRKMQQKLKNLGIPLPGSSQVTNSGSMDLVTLFIVNQIAAKKENKDEPKVAVFGSSKAGSKHKRNEPLVLPMSPCAPSQLSLVESEPQCSQGTRKRKHVIPQVFKCKQLSPVLESGFSDNSASDYLPPITGPHSPFSSTSSASSCPGIFPLQLNPQERSQPQTELHPHCSPSLWDVSGPEQIKFQPFLQPTLMKEPWSCGSKPLLYQIETPAAVQGLFGSPQPSNPEVGNHDRQGVTFAVSQTDDKESVLGFTLSQSEAVEQFGNEFFQGFSREASDFGRAKLKIYLKDDTSNRPRSQAVDSQCREVEFSSCTDTSFSHPRHIHTDCCEYSPGYHSSHSDDDDECCQTCLHAASSDVDHVCCADTLNKNLGSEWNPTPLTPHTKPKVNSTDDCEKQSTENVDCHDQSGGNDEKQARSRTHTPSTELCKCKKTSCETQDADTQTVDSPTAETCDAATQCCFVSDSVTKPSVFNFCQQTSDVSVPRLATGRQSDCTDAAAQPHKTPSDSSTSAGKHKLWSRNTYRAGSLSGGSILNQLAANNRERRAILQAPINPFQHNLKSNTRGKKDGEGRDKENGPQMKENLDDVMEETSRVNRHSEDPETLQEIADILLLLRQKKEE
ncbi:uncharacterized protein LOC117504257 [Thalassophryne amazonica]|uniref:uncharacterized protein LOC117504257 n=1 Tax=Thalassophryne amazonica TaxID=390379 RepID=UPI0014716A21|nr:uncharacterized protein LOC117504257 [Thalassophryne amazonica]